MSLLSKAMDAAQEGQTATSLGVDPVIEAPKAPSASSPAGDFLSSVGTQPLAVDPVEAEDESTTVAVEAETSEAEETLSEDEESDQEKLYRLIVGGAEKNIAMPDGSVRAVMARLLDRNYTLSDGQVLKKGDVAYVLKGDKGQTSGVIESLPSQEYQSRMIRDHGAVTGVGVDPSQAGQATQSGAAAPMSDRVSMAERVGAEVAGVVGVAGKAALGVVSGGMAGLNAVARKLTGSGNKNPTMDEAFDLASRQVPGLAEWRVKGMEKVIRDGNSLLTMADNTMRDMARDPAIRNLRKQIGEITSGDSYERQQQKSMMIDEMQRHIRSDPRLSALQKDLITYANKAERKFSIAADQANKYGMTEELRLMLDTDKMKKVSLNIDEYTGEDSLGKSERIREAAQKLIELIQAMFRNKYPSPGPTPSVGR